MKEIKRCFCNFSYYDQRAIQEKLEEMAEKGWMLEKPGSFMWTYKRAEAKKLRFSVTYFPSASDFDPSPTDGELTKIDYCRQDGWNLVTSWGVMQIFCNENRASHAGRKYLPVHEKECTLSSSCTRRDALVEYYHSIFSMAAGPCGRTLQPLFYLFGFDV